jgi:2-keto-4-pentenoate hydratase/2-oxohepta-3-ene-1,7-dioic acid hydratase in catechol pathway
MSKQKSSTPKSEHSPMLTKAIINNKTNENKTFAVKILKRENGGLGFLIRQRELQPYFSVWEIIKNGSAESCGKINKGDLMITGTMHGVAVAAKNGKTGVGSVIGKALENYDSEEIGIIEVAVGRL